MLRQVIKKKKEAYLCAKQTAEGRIRYDFNGAALGAGYLCEEMFDHTSDLLVFAE
jgi:hypothetical protein